MPPRSILALCLASLTLPNIARLPALTGTVQVPLDHRDLALGRAPISYELGAPFDSAKPVLFIIADGQQFYVRPGEVAGIQRESFGDEFNVVGIIGRGSSRQFIDAARGPEGKTDWERAWRLFNADQWVEDIDAVRAALVGDEGAILLFGASGGSLLVHQYLAKHGAHVRRAVTAAPVEPFIVGELGLNSDRFQQEVEAHDPSLPAHLSAALRLHATDRVTLVMTLQRQNFFVPPDQLPQERAPLIRALAAGNEEKYAQARQQYQVEVVRGFFDSPKGIPVRVREFELFYPSGARGRLGGGIFLPDLENQSNFAAPLAALCDASRIPAPSYDRAAAHHLDTEVFVLTGRWDHTVDYRAAIALAARYPRHLLFIAEDDHLLGRMKGSGSYPSLIRALLASGLGSARLEAALKEAAPHRWMEP